MNYVIIGAGGFAREVHSVIIARGHSVSCFIVERQYIPPSASLDNIPVRDFQWLLRGNQFGVICGVGSPDLRRRLVVLSGSIRFADAVIHPTATLGYRCTTGTGSVISAGVAVTANVHIGDHVVLHLNATVGHDAVMEDYVSVMPGANISGRVTLGEGAYVGVGAAIVQGVHIGAWSKVGAGSVVINDVPANSTVVGVPGRVVRQRPDGWHL